MPFPTSRSTQYDVHIATPSTQQFHQVLQVRSNIFRAVTTGSLNQFESTPISQNNALLPISLCELYDDPIVFQFYIEQFLSSLDIDAVTCEIVAEEIALNINQMTAGNRDTSLHIVAVINTTEITWIAPTDSELDGGVVGVDGGSPARKKVKMERLEEKIGEDLGDCCICLNQFNWEERVVVKIPCGHVYDESCILKWLDKNHTCPLCRSPVPMELDDQQ